MHRFIALVVALILSTQGATIPVAMAQSDGVGSTADKEPVRYASAASPADGAKPNVDPEKAPPFDLADEDRIEAGKKRFNRTCAAYCHGHEGSGGRTPSFKGRTGLNADFVFKTITNGRRGADVMPKWGNSLSAETRWELTAYIMYLTTLPADSQ